MGEVSVYEWILEGRIALWVRSARHLRCQQKLELAESKLGLSFPLLSPLFGIVAWLN